MSNSFVQLQKTAFTLGLYIEADIAKPSDKADRHIFTALGPLLRQIAEQYMGEDGKSGMDTLDGKFHTLFSKEIGARKGKPTLFKGCCHALELTADDSKWMFHIVLLALLQGVVARFSQHLAAGVERLPGFSSGELESEAQAASEPTFQMGPPIENGHWQSLERASAAVWSNFVLGYSLNRLDEDSARTIEKALRQTASKRTSSQRRAQSELRSAEMRFKGELSLGTKDDGLASDGIVDRTNIEFAAGLIHLALGALESAKEPSLKLTEVGMVNGRRKRDVRRIVPSALLLSKLSTLKEGHRLADPSGPVRWRPTPWSIDGATKEPKQSNLRHGSLEFYKFRAKNTRIRQFLYEMDNAHGSYDQIFSAVNALQETKWHINQRIWKVMRILISASGDPDVLATGLPQQFAKDALQIDIGEGWKKWLEDHFFARHAAKNSTDGRKLRKDVSAPGWRLVSPMGAHEVLRLAPHREFYFAHNVDSRGRIYAIGSYLHPQSEDTFRSLLEFSEGMPITEEGVKWLALHGSQCAARQTILNDLGIQDRTSPTIDERVGWIETRTKQICESASDPIKSTWWRDVGGKTPFQFLAFCFAWNDYKTRGYGSPCRLPVHVDGTCNGLQHIAALTGNRKLASAVNLLPGPPRDIYAEMATVVQIQASNPDRVMESPSRRRKTRFEEAFAKHERELRTILNAHPGLVDRDAAKKVVMVIPYGAGVTRYAVVLHSRVKEYQGGAEFEQALERMGTDAADLVIAYRNAKATRNLVKQNSKSTGGAKISLLPRIQDENEWMALYYGRLMLATLIAREFEQALETEFPIVGKFKAWLLYVAKVFSEKKIPLAWVTPIGFPVLQNCFSDDVESIDIRGFARIRMSHHVIRDDVDARKQVQGILPNFIHSLDSSHLVATVNLAKTEGVLSFSMVHDSFGTHAAHMPKLAKALRTSFKGIYECDIRADFAAWTNEVLATVQEYSVAGEPKRSGADARSILKYLLAVWAVEERNKQQNSETTAEEAKQANQAGEADVAEETMKAEDAEPVEDTKDEKEDNFPISEVDNSEYFFY